MRRRTRRDWTITTAAFLCGFAFGLFSVALFLSKQSYNISTSNRPLSSPVSSDQSQCQCPLASTKAHRNEDQKAGSSHRRRDSNEQLSGTEKLMEMDAEPAEAAAQHHPLIAFGHQHDHRDSLAVWLRDRVRVLCWIATTPANTEPKAVPINATWAPRCNKHVFIAADPESGLPNVQLHMEETRKALWGKTKKAFKHLYETELNNFDWFLKADDDTYVIVENLRLMLAPHSPEKPIYFGCKFKPFVKQGYMSGGSGYVLSREALRRFVEQGLSNGTICKKSDFGAEDAELGICMERLGVEAGDSRDENGRHRMLPFSPLSHFESDRKLPAWFLRYLYYPYKQGNECCSDYMVSFHYVTRPLMYAIHNLVYHVRPFGIHQSFATGIAMNLSMVLNSTELEL